MATVDGEPGFPALRNMASFVAYIALFPQLRAERIVRLMGMWCTTGNSWPA